MFKRQNIQGHTDKTQQKLNTESRKIMWSSVDLFWDNILQINSQSTFKLSFYFEKGL